MVWGGGHDPRVDNHCWLRSGADIMGRQAGRQAAAWLELVQAQGQRQHGEVSEERNQSPFSRSRDMFLQFLKMGK